MMLKNKLFIGMIVFIAMLVIGTISFAATGVVDTDTLNFRKEMSTDSTILAQLNEGDSVEIIEKDGDWYKIKARGMTGYVFAEFIKTSEVIEQKTEPVVEEPKTEEPKVEESKTEEPKQETEKKEVVLGTRKLINNSQVYILPLINSSKIGNLKKDSSVEVLSIVNNWAYIQTNELNGWVLKSYLKNEVENNNTTSDIIEENGSNSTEKKNDNGDSIYESRKVMYVNTSSIYVRKGPSTDYEIIDSLILNSGVNVLGENGDWYKVMVDEKEGYIAKRLLSETTSESTSRGDVVREPSSNENIVSTSSNLGESIVEYAKQYLGCKYVYGGSGPSSFDCSGFTMYVYKNFGINLSHSAIAQSKKGVYVEKEDLQPGDLVFFKDYETMDGIGHCGIYVGNGDFIHASSGTGYCVKISTLLSGSYNTRYETARRII